MSTEQCLKLQTKKLVSSLTNISNYFGIWNPTDFIELRLNILRLY